MRNEHFEAKIKRIVEAFDRNPPQNTWDHIQQELAEEKSCTQEQTLPKWMIPAGLMAALIILGLLARPFFIPKTPWLDNYWDALALAKQANKPLLVYITRNCPDCRVVDQALKQPHIIELIDQFTAVRLVADDQRPIDSSLIDQMFPGIPKTIAKEGVLMVQVAPDSMALSTYGQVWERLQSELTPYTYYGQKQPFLAVFDAQLEEMSGGLYPNPTVDNQTDRAIEEWLDLQLGILQGNHLQGRRLFVARCRQCHAGNMKDVLTGPALGGVREKWSDYPDTDLYRFIRESQAMIAEGHPRAVEQWEQWAPTVMLNFPGLSDPELKKLVDYIEWRYRQN